MQLIKLFTMPVISVAAIITTLLLPTIPQDVHYHNFSDQRSFLGIVNCLNVITNLPYLLVGVAGIYTLMTKPQLIVNASLKNMYITFFAAVALISFGSGYYHLNPSNYTLLWDRIPMALAFMAFFSIVVAEFVNERLARKIFLPLLIAGVSSVIYWYWSETQQQGDLRFYLLVQFLPVILIPIILLTYRSRFNRNYYYWLIIACYVLAKLLESGDGWVFASSGFVSGHSLKHLASALAPYLFYLYVLRRQAV